MFTLAFWLKSIIKTSPWRSAFPHILDSRDKWKIVADFVISVLSRQRHYNEPENPGSVGGSSSQCQLLSQQLAPKCPCLHDPVMISLHPWGLTIESIRWISPSICHHSLSPPVCCALLIVCTVYRLLIGIVLLRAILAATYVAGTAVKRGQEMLMSYRLSLDASPQPQCLLKKETELNQ